MNIYTLVLADNESGKSPYPIHVNEDGTVGRQDFWEELRGILSGVPEYLLGFQDVLSVNAVDLPFNLWLPEVDQAIGMFPVFLDNDYGEVWTHARPVSQVRVVESDQPS